MNPSIQIWPYHLAPEEYKKLSHHGGDEDWVALIPTEIKEEITKYGLPFWLEKIDTTHEPQEINMPNGDLVLIGAHS